MSAKLCRSTQIKMYSWDNAQVVLVGNKCDAEDERVISTERGKYLADSLGRTVGHLEMKHREVALFSRSLDSLATTSPGSSLPTDLCCDPVRYRVAVSCLRFECFFSLWSDTWWRSQLCDLCCLLCVQCMGNDQCFSLTGSCGKFCLQVVFFLLH